MLTKFHVSLSLGVCLLLLSSTATATESAHELRTQFEDFKTTYQRSYASKAEEAKRFAIFARNVVALEKQRRANPHATFGVNEFADLTPQEFTVRVAGAAKTAAERKGTRTAEKVTSSSGAAALPQTVDWRSKGAVSPVQAQGNCLASYAFAATGNIEGQWAIAGNPLVALSAQELVSCDMLDDACGGGAVVTALDYLVTTRRQLLTAAAYPYTSGINGTAGKCEHPSGATGVAIRSFGEIATDESAIAAKVAAVGPIAVMVDPTSWQLYQSGVLTTCVSNTPSHGALIVGYDLTASPAYWIVKNSWGTSWGEQGYIRIQYGLNLCLIANAPVTAVIVHTPAPPTPVPPPTTPAPTSKPTSAPTTPKPTPAPPPPTPAPPPPPPPSTTPGAPAFVTQLLCDDEFCIGPCNQSAIPQATCVPMGSGSAIAVCSIPYVQVTQFPFTTNCSGYATVWLHPVNQCELGDGSPFYELVCPTGPGPFVPAPAAWSYTEVDPHAPGLAVRSRYKKTVSEGRNPWSSKRKH